MAKPFFKWPGGKANLVPQLQELLPEDYRQRRHVEPFVGGGALFFAMEPEQAFLADKNKRLMSLYTAMLLHSERVLQDAKRLLRNHSETHFYAQRELFNKVQVWWTPRQAARFLYLNKTCFNGVYRENSSGEFNVPIGRYTDPKIDVEVFREAVRVLKAGNTYLEIQSFEETFEQVAPGDFVYIDPPYDETFTGYQAGGFSRKDQHTLAEAVDTALLCCAKVMISVPDTRLMRKLYKHLDMTKVQASRSVGCKGSTRGKVTELVFRNY